MLQPISAGLNTALSPVRPSRPFRFLGSLLQILTGNRKALVGFVIIGIMIIVAVFAPLISPYDPSAAIFNPGIGPTRAHLLGTTAPQGADIFSQLVWGTRETLLIALLAGLFTTVLAILFGVTAAYMGGVVDNLLSSITDIFLVIPALPLMIIIAAFAQGGGMWVLIAVISVTGWSYGARQMRPQALSLRNRDFLESARVRGEGAVYLIACELLPNMLSLIVAIFLGAALYAVLASAGLQFIGLGNPSDQSWGTMLYWANNSEALYSGSPLWVIVPGACIALLGAAVALINYAVDEIGNPALRTAKRRKRGRRAPAPG
ncbi:MAG TPA: ABC transporter permease [Chloroflexota bacterium]|jgi:peptide/nickel transport system permease protein|nr:ABC transporter permease [Chloroflexota bacterium]